MSKKFASGIYKPRHPSKYKGNKYPVYRSSWELKVFQFFDLNNNVIAWASEPFSISYIDPITGKRKNYIPDLLIVYKNKRGKIIKELIEIKPKKETFIKEANSRSDRIKVLVNSAKWKAAYEWCKKHGLKFRVITEDDIFGR